MPTSFDRFVATSSESTCCSPSTSEKLEPIDLSVLKEQKLQVSTSKQISLFRPYAIGERSPESIDSKTSRLAEVPPTSSSSRSSSSSSSSPAQSTLPTLIASDPFPVSALTGSDLLAVTSAAIAQQQQQQQQHRLQQQSHCFGPPYWNGVKYGWPFLALLCPPCQWYQKRVSRPLCGKYVKSGPAASPMTLMAVRQRVIQRLEMKLFLRSVSGCSNFVPSASVSWPLDRNSSQVSDHPSSPVTQ